MNIVQKIHEKRCVYPFLKMCVICEELGSDDQFPHAWFVDDVLDSESRKQSSLYCITPKWHYLTVDEARKVVPLGHIVDNKALGVNFVGMAEQDMALWLKTFLTKYYYV